jgi:hypothetical protein
MTRRRCIPLWNAVSRLLDWAGQYLDDAADYCRTCPDCGHSTTSAPCMGPTGR